MIIEKPRDCDIILKNSLEIFNAKFFLNRTAKKELSFLFFEYCLNKLNLQNVELNFKTSLGSEKGNSVKDKIEISTKNFFLNSIVDIFTTISHEVRHSKQHKTLKPFKSFETREINRYPIDICTGYLPYLQVPDFDSFPYYLTSNNEKDARDYSNELTKEFFADLMNLTNNISLKKQLQGYIKKVDNNIDIENNLYSKNLCYVNITYKSLKNMVTQQVELRLPFYKYCYKNKEFDKCQSLPLIIQPLLLLYSDDNIVEQIINFAIEIDNKETIYICLNHQNTNISKDVFKKAFSYLNKSKNIDKDEIFNNLGYWKVDVLNDFWNEYNKENKKYKSKKVLTNNLDNYKVNENISDDEKTL